jgi:hypothetical protein
MHVQQRSSTYLSSLHQASLDEGAMAYNQAQKYKFFYFPLAEKKIGLVEKPEKN